MRYKITRTYRDLSGKWRVLEFVKTAQFVHWHKDHAACFSNIWRDTEDGYLLQIPENAFECLGMPYEDKYEAESDFDSDNTVGLRGVEKL
jgi:hypothetical protein